MAVGGGTVKKTPGLKLEDETILDEVALTTHQWGYQLMADPTSNRYVNERPRGVLTYEVGLLRFHVIDGIPFESTLFPFHPVQQWEESCSHVCGYKNLLFETHTSLLLFIGSFYQ